MSHMSEAERRAVHEAESLSGDQGDWEDVPTPKKRRLNSMISVRLSPTEAATIRAAAESEGVSVSAYLRSAALEHATATGPVSRTDCLRREFVQGQSLGVVGWTAIPVGSSGLSVASPRWSNIGTTRASA